MDHRVISKCLSSNDTGENGSHQAGILVPKESDILSFFPDLDPTKENPRILMNIIDEDNYIWEWNYIYYNNRLRGGTRNEYRLTGMTAYFRKYGLRNGDSIELSREQNHYKIISRKKQKDDKAETINTTNSSIKKNLVLGNGWKIVKY